MLNRSSYTLTYLWFWKLTWTNTETGNTTEKWFVVICWGQTCTLYLVDWYNLFVELVCGYYNIIIGSCGCTNMIITYGIFQLHVYGILACLSAFKYLWVVSHLYLRVSVCACVCITVREHVSVQICEWACMCACIVRVCVCVYVCEEAWCYVCGWLVFCVSI